MNDNFREYSRSNPDFAHAYMKIISLLIKHSMLTATTTSLIRSVVVTAKTNWMLMFKVRTA